MTLAVFDSLILLSSYDTTMESKKIVHDFMQTQTWYIETEDGNSFHINLLSKIQRTGTYTIKLGVLLGSETTHSRHNS